MHAGKCASEILMGKSNLEDLNVDGLTLLRRILMKQCVSESSGFSWLMIG